MSSVFAKSAKGAYANESVVQPIFYVKLLFSEQLLGSLETELQHLVFA